MIKIDKILSPTDDEVLFAIEGMRNAFASWDKSDSKISICERYSLPDGSMDEGNAPFDFHLGKCDSELMTTLIKCGADERKFLRGLPVHMRITAPLYWWKEFDTYKVGTVSCSESTMHSLCGRPFEPSDFSIEDLKYEKYGTITEEVDGVERVRDDSVTAFENIRNVLNAYRYQYLKARKKGKEDLAKYYWRQIIQLLPSSYNQTRNITLNYEVLCNIYKARKNHKLSEWREFCKICEDQVAYFNVIKEAFERGPVVKEEN